MSSTISFQCYSCNQVLRVAADKAGKKAKCPKCDTPLTIPFASAAPAAPAPPAAAPSGSFPSLELDEAPPPAAPKRPAAAAPPPPKPAGTPPPRQPLRVELVEEEVAPPPPPPPPRRPAASGPFDQLDEVEELPPEEEPYEEDYEPRDRDRDRDRGRRSERDREQSLPPWFFPRLGLLLVFIASCVWAGAFLLLLIGYLMFSVALIQALTGSPSAGGGPAGSGDAFTVLIRVGEIVSLIGSLGALVGYVFFILGPKDRGKLGLAIAVVAVAGVGLVLAIFKLMIIFGGSLFGAPAAQGSIFGTWFVLVLCQLLFVAELVLVPLYLAQVVRSVRKRSDLARQATFTISVTGAYGGLRLLTWILLYVLLNSFGARSDPRALMWITLILFWLGNFTYIGQAIWYTITLWKVRCVMPVDGRR